MSKQKERMNTLANAGIETGKYFSLELPTGLKPGTKIHVMISEDGSPVITPEKEEKLVHETNDDVMIQQIMEDGYIANSKLYRRWVMAQMFRALNYQRYETKVVYGAYGYSIVKTLKASGYNDYVKEQYPYFYQFTMMKDELEQLLKLQYSDQMYFCERAKFFTKEVVIATCEDYLTKLQKYVANLPTKEVAGRSSKFVFGRRIYMEDMERELYAPVKNYIRIMSAARSLLEFNRAYVQFMNHMYSLPVDTPKAKAWKDAFKGAGAYYTCKNLILYHDCKVTGVYGTATDHVRYLEGKLHEYQGEGWRMFAFMNKLIEDNLFDFKRRMEEIYRNK